MFIHDHYKKLAIEAIKKDLKNFNEDCLEEIAYNEKDFNNRIFVFNYSSDVTYLYVVTSFGIAEFLQKADIRNKKSCLDILNIGEAFPLNNIYKVNVSYNHIEDICYISMIMSHRYDIDTKAFVALSKKYNLDFNTIIIDWNECFAHKLRIEKGVIINDEEIEDDDAIYFEFF